MTVSAELQAIGDPATFRGRFTEKDGTCSFTYSESGTRRFATRTITLGSTSAEGGISQFTVTFSSRCRD